MILTTDQYIDKFLPFRITKSYTEVLCQIFANNKEYVHRAQVIEKNKLSELYVYLTSNSQVASEDQCTTLFK